MGLFWEENYEEKIRKKNEENGIKKLKLEEKEKEEYLHLQAGWVMASQKRY